MYPTHTPGTGPFSDTVILEPGTYSLVDGETPYDEGDNRLVKYFSNIPPGEHRLQTTANTTRSKLCVGVMNSELLVITGKLLKCSFTVDHPTACFRRDEHIYVGAMRIDLNDVKRLDEKKYWETQWTANLSAVEKQYRAALAAAETEDYGTMNAVLKKAQENMRGLVANCPKGYVFTNGVEQYEEARYALLSTLEAGVLQGHDIGPFAHVLLSKPCNLEDVDCPEWKIKLIADNIFRGVPERWHYRVRQKVYVRYMDLITNN